MHNHDTSSSSDSNNNVDVDNAPGAALLESHVTHWGDFVSVSCSLNLMRECNESERANAVHTLTRK